MAAGTLALALGFMLLVIDSGRLYLEQRKLQRVADTAALEAVTRDGNCLSGASATAYATQSATRNGFTVNADNTLTVSCGTVQIGADHLRAFSADPKKSAAVQVIATRTVATSFAAGIGAALRWAGQPHDPAQRHGRRRRTQDLTGAIEHPQHPVGRR
jgi:uncharacterized membrane protein